MEFDPTILMKEQLRIFTGKIRKFYVEMVDYYFFFFFAYLSTLAKFQSSMLKGITDDSELNIVRCYKQF